MKKFFCLFIVLLLAIFSFSCHKNDELVIVLDNSEPLALAPDVEWAVVTDPYAAYKKEIGWTSGVSGHCRKGEILQVKGKSVTANNESWYYFENGWLPSNCLAIYNNRLKAQSVSENLLQKK